MCNEVSNNELKERQLIEKLNQIVQLPDPPKTPLLRMKHISHLDLDGYGATILSEILQTLYPEDAMTLEIRNILPNKLMLEISDTINSIDDYDFIVITDLAINQNIVDLINNCKNPEKFKIFDHHIPSIEKIPENSTITTVSPFNSNKLTCATELYYNFIIHDKIYELIHDDRMKNNLKYLVECIRVYDTFEFWNSRNNPINEIEMTYWDAPRLNTLFHIMERNEFREYIKYYVYHLAWNTLTISTSKFSWITKILELENNKNIKYVESALRRMFKIPFKYSIYNNGKIYDLDYRIGVIFAEKSSPIIANTALESHSDIDLCAVVSNNQVSIYTNRENVDVSKIAKLFGGGGHKEAAGFTIPYTSSTIFNMRHFTDIIECAGKIENCSQVSESMNN